MMLEQTVEGTSLTDAHGAKSKPQTIQIQSVVDSGETDRTLIDLQELLLQIVEKHNTELQAEVALPQKNKKKQDAKKKTEQKNLTSITKDVEEIPPEEETIIDDAPFVSYDGKGEELFAKRQYQQMLEQYATFLTTYLKESKYREFKPDLSGYNNGGKNIQDTQTTEVQMLNYDEKFDHVRAKVMNSFMGGAGANVVDANIGDSWDLWRVFQHNHIWSVFYTSQWRNS
jgi:hypothetical protein